MGKFKLFDTKQILTIFCGLILGYQNVMAQSGYNYARPDIVVGGGGGGGDAIGAGRTNIPSSGQTSVRPVPTGFPSAATAGGAAFPTAATGYGAAGTATQPYAGFSAQAQRSPATIVPTSIAGFAGASAGRPTLQTQRPAGGIFGIGQQYPVTGTGRGGGGSGTGTGTGTGSSDDDYNGDFSAIPGIPGVNYPIYAQVPPTNFDCAQQPLPGYYSDIEAQCQVFHICALNRTYSFLCPNGTIFSQETLVCVWWNQYDCVSAPSLYANNAFIYDYGSQGPPSNSGGGGGGVGAGYQTNVAQVGIIGGAGANNRQQQSVFQAQTSSGRTSNSPIGAGIYGSAGAVRPTIASNAFASGGQTAFPGGTSNAAANRFTPGTTAQQTGQATFPTGAPASGGNLFGTPIRNDGYVTGLQDNAFPAAQITSKTTNREYLPPSRRP